VDLSAEEVAALLRHKHSGARVLLAEDNPINSMLAMELLCMAGMAATAVKNGREALALLERGDAFDLVLMDVHMPEMDGLQATRLIRQLPAQADLPIVAMTASVLQEEKDACMASGMNGHLGKPVDTQALFKTLLYWLDRRGQGVSSPGEAASMPPGPGADAVNDLPSVQRA
jgi:CheY-like chemotaxis protein